MSGYRAGRVFYFRMRPGKTVDEMQWAMAAKYLAGESSGEERRTFEQWLAEDPERSAVLDSLRPYFGARAATRTPVDVAAAWTRMSARIDREAMGVESGRPGAPRWRDARWRQWGMAAAAVLVVAAGASLVIARNVPDPDRAPVATGPGERRDITLADGSRILLAPLSRLEIVGDRSAKLAGEAYFVVVHDSRRTFRVETGDAIVEDLGTSFVVRAGSAQRPTFVAVEEGVVSLALPASQGRAGALVLREGESGTISSAGAVRDDSATWSRGLAWTRGEIVFDEMRLRDVARELHRWFGITVLLADPSLETRTLSARFSGESVDEILRVIDRSLGLTHTREGDSVIFRP